MCRDLGALLNPLPIFGNLPIFCLRHKCCACHDVRIIQTTQPGARTARADQQTAPEQISAPIISAVKLRSWNPIVFFFLSICQTQEETGRG